MKNINRRKFIESGAKGVAGAVIASAGMSGLSCSSKSYAEIDLVDLGETGMKVPRLALGTGSGGWKHSSNQKRMGEKNFLKMARHAYDRGVRFLETADMYGTHEFVGKALSEVDREKVTVLTKVMVYRHQDWYSPEPFQKSIDRFRKELNTDYIDILLLHCMVNDEWPDEYKRYMDDFMEAKEKGIIKKVGLSCHDFAAMEVAAKSDWPDILLARINYGGAKMDGPPKDVMPVLKSAKDSGKGVIGMKIFGCGDLVQENQREKSLNYVMKSDNVHCMTIGMESIDQVDDTVERVMRIAKS